MFASEIPLIEVEGDPRAMGRAQGELCRDAIRKATVTADVRGRTPASLRPFITGRILGEGMGREIVRHYPHLSERVQGLARGSGQSIASLMGLFVGAALGHVDAALVEPVPGAGCAGDAPLLVRPISASEWIVRRSRPEVGFRSVELTLPWLATSVAGVNESGVAAMIAPTAPGRPRTAGTAAPSALLLVQECLQRFRDVTGCIDWCLKRPTSGAASIVVADAAGMLAGVALAGDERRVLSPSGGVLVAGGCDDRHVDLRKSLQARSSAGDPPAELAAEIGAGVVALAKGRSLRVRLSAGDDAKTFSVA